MTEIHKDNIDNEEIRCRICYQEKKPLITICECLGSIAYVHSDCILDWIHNKILREDASEMLCCQICKSFYSIDFRIDKKEISLRTLMSKIKEAKMTQIILIICIIILTMIAFYLTTLMLIHGFSFFWQNVTKEEYILFHRKIDLFTFCYTNLWIIIVLPIFYVKVFYQCIKKILHFQDQTNQNINIRIILKPMIIIGQSQIIDNPTQPQKVKPLS